MCEFPRSSLPVYGNPPHLNLDHPSGLLLGKRGIKCRVNVLPFGGPMTRLFLVFATLVFTFSQSGNACTTVSLASSTLKLMGKSYDWDLSHGYVTVNKKNVKKTALAINPIEKPATWTSKYGSTTFNQYGQEFPLSGINEKGLAVEILWLDETEYPAMDSRKSINELQWVQYQLDNFESVAELVANVEKIRIASVQAPVHYMSCDSTAACATIEFLEGKAVVHTGETLPYKLITNDTYERSVQTLKNFEGFGGTEAIPQSMKSLDRFVRAASLAKSQAPSISNVFRILASVKQGGYSVWNIVYNLSLGEVSFRTHAKPRIRQFDSRKFDYSCKNPVMALDIQEDLEGDVTQSFSVFKMEENRRMIEKSLKDGSVLHNILIEQMVKYPSTTRCME